MRAGIVLVIVGTPGGSGGVIGPRTGFKVGGNPGGVGGEANGFLRICTSKGQCGPGNVMSRKHPPQPQLFVEDCRSTTKGVLLIIVHPRSVSGRWDYSTYRVWNRSPFFTSSSSSLPAFFNSLLGFLVSLCVAVLKALVSFLFFLPSSPRRHFSHIDPFPTMVQLCHALFGSWVHCAANVQPLVYGIRVNRVFEGEAAPLTSEFPWQILL